MLYDIKKLVGWFDQASESPLGVGYETDEKDPSDEPSGVAVMRQFTHKYTLFLFPYFLCFGDQKKCFQNEIASTESR